MKLARQPFVTSVSLLFLLILAGCKTTPQEREVDQQGDDAATMETAGEGSTGDKPSQRTEGQQEGADETKVTEERVARVVCAPDDEMCRVNNMGPTSFGEVSQGMNASMALEAFGEPSIKEPRYTNEASGDIIEQWVWKDKGIILDFLAPTMTGPVSQVASFTLLPPFDTKNHRDVGIGSTEQEVLRAYAHVMDPLSQQGDQIIVGSVYGGIFFSIQRGKVTSIFVGAGAE